MNLYKLWNCEARRHFKTFPTEELRRRRHLPAAVPGITLQNCESEIQVVASFPTRLYTATLAVTGEWHSVAPCFAMVQAHRKLWIPEQVLKASGKATAPHRDVPEAESESKVARFKSAF